MTRRTLRHPIAICLALSAILLVAGTGCLCPNRGLAQELALVRHDYGLPAMAGAVVRADSIVDVQTTGVRRRGYADPVTVDDRFHLGSLTKAMTATMIATLVEEGKLAWDAKLVDLFADIASTMDPGYRDVALNQVLAHRAGFPPVTTPEDWAQIPGLTGTPTEQRLAYARWLVSRPPDHPAGQYEYSNAGYGVAAAIAEQAAGQSWEDLMQTRVFDPLGIDGRYGWPAREDPNQPWGHWTIDGNLAPQDPNGAYQIPPILAPAGDINMSVGDYARYVQAHLRGLEGRDDLLRAGTVAQLHTPIGTYALGWAVNKTKGVVTHTHEGSAGTFTSLVAIQPKRDLAVVVITNAANKNTSAALQEAAEDLLCTYKSRD